MDHKYFAYGSNLVIERITERIGKVKFLGSTSLENWGIRFNKLGKDGTGKCNILKIQGEVVYGVIYEISREQKRKLDEFEQGYETITLKIPLIGKCISYSAHDISNETVSSPFDWYKALVVTGAEKCGFPASYISRLQEQKTIIDPNHERRTKNLKVFDDLNT